VPVVRRAEQRLGLADQASVVLEDRRCEMQCRGTIGRDVQSHGRLAPQLE